MMLISLEYPGNFSWSTKSLSQVEEKTFSYKHFRDFHRGKRKKDRAAFCKIQSQKCDKHFSPLPL